MVRLEKLTMQGFKSFKRKVSIPFPVGFSVITGPNGSGKTNVSDAISFVLGKSSAKELRAQKTHNLIFHGSQKKEGSDYANVVLYFDNSAGRIPLKEKTASISRRVNKNGVSTYRLNGRVVTRQQIIDIFSQVGIHPDGHNIIKQGDVNQIVEMDAVQRREILDEISGILEYDEKKNKAKKELSKIEEKVREAEILLNEREAILNRLERDRNAALEYQKLESDLEKIRASIVLKKYHQTENELKSVSKDLEKRESIYDDIEEDVKKFDEKILEEEKNFESLAKDLLKASNQIEVTKKITKIRADIERKTDTIEANKREMERLDSLIARLRSMDSKFTPAFKKVLQFKGVSGVLSNLITIPEQYRIAVEVAAGSHLKDIIVDDTNTAVTCIKYLKTNKAGRARFLPLDKIKPFGKKNLPVGAIGWLSELVHHDPKYTQAIDYVFSTTACVKDIDKAKSITRNNRVRMVTLDGDLIETSGAMTGGYYKPKQKLSYESEVSGYEAEKKRLIKENERLESELIALNKELDIYASEEKETKTFKLEKDKIKFDERLTKIRGDRKSCYEKRLILQQEIGKLNIGKAKLEAKFENLKLEWEDHKESVNERDLKPFLENSVEMLKHRQKDSIEKINSIGPVNLKAIKDFESVKEVFTEFKEKVEKIILEKESILNTINRIEEKRKYAFDHTLNEISGNFKETYKDLTGGEADLMLDEPNNVESGLLIKASPSGKKLLHIDSMSGGEKTLTAFAFLFAIQRHKPSPFYILDEADATLDGANTKRVVVLIKRHSKSSQFIIISHNDSLIKEADQVYGVSMEDGESKIMGIRLPKEN